MATQLQFRRGTNTEWNSINPVLLNGEVGVSLTDLTFKIGDGASSWTSLSGTIIPSLISSLNLYQTVPSGTPASGSLNLFAYNIANRILPAFKGPSGLTSSIQPSLAGNGFYSVTPGNAVTMSVIGGPAVAVVGAATHPTLSSTDLVTQTSRMQILSATGTNSASELRTTYGRSWRGDMDGAGGVLFRSRFAITATTTGSQFYAGLTGSTLATVATQTPSALTNLIAVAFDAADANFQIMHNDAVGVATKINLGASFPRNLTDTIYEINFFISPNDAMQVNYQFSDLGNALTITGTVLNSDLPISTTFLSAHLFLNTGAVSGTAVGLQVMKLYIESDY